MMNNYGRPYRRGYPWTFSHLVLFIVFILPFSTYLFSRMPGPGESYTEYEIKAVLLGKFADFIEWPANSAFIRTNDSFVIAVIGETSIDKYLEKLFYANTIKEKKVIVIKVKRVEDIPECHILFIASSENNKLEEIIEFLNNKPILTIADTEGFADRGVQVNLVIRRSRTRFEINETALKNTGLSVSYLLLKSASEIIEPLKRRR